MDKEYIVVMVTTSSQGEAEIIVQRLLEAKLIACGNIVGPAFSRFHWEGKIDGAEEFLVIMKSRRDLFEALTKAVMALHSYDVPEIIALPVVDGSPDYLAWLDSCLK